MRQLLADKVNGNMVGLWLLLPEHLRLGTWDLLCGWTDQDGDCVEPRLALQLVHEAALCTTGLRQKRTLSQKGIAPEQFTRRWVGYATTQLLYKLSHSQSGAFYQYIQRQGEREQDWTFRALLSTSDRDEVDTLTLDYPKRWHVEEFFNTHQALGWKRACTMNLNVRYGQMTIALIAQAVIHQLRQRLGEPVSIWDAEHLAKSLFRGLDRDVRVRQDTIVVTYYNAPNVERLREYYENLPDKLQQENVDPRIPWLYGFKLDFRLM